MAKDIAGMVGRLATRSRAQRELLEEIKQRVRGDLLSDERGRFEGPLGEAIANESGNYSGEFTSPEEIAQSFCNWLDAQDFNQGGHSGDGGLKPVAAVSSLEEADKTEQDYEKRLAEGKAECEKWVSKHRAQAEEAEAAGDEKRAGEYRVAADAFADALEAFGVDR